MWKQALDRHPDCLSYLLLWGDAEKNLYKKASHDRGIPHWKRIRRVSLNSLVVVTVQAPSAPSRDAKCYKAPCPRSSQQAGARSDWQLLANSWMGFQLGHLHIWVSSLTHKHWAMSLLTCPQLHLPLLITSVADSSWVTQAHCSNYPGSTRRNISGPPFTSS